MQSKVTHFQEPGKVETELEGKAEGEVEELWEEERSTGYLEWYLIGGMGISSKNRCLETNNYIASRVGSVQEERKKSIV